MPVRRPGQSRRDAGQAAVEFAVALPLIVVVVLAIAQVGVSIRHEIAVEAAARAGARAAAVSADPGSARAAARQAVALPMDIDVHSDGRIVSVTVTYIDPTDIAIIGALLGSVAHTATATMAIEPP